MILRAFACIFSTLLFFGVPGAFPQDAQPKEPSTETKTANEQPVILGDKILFYIPTESEGVALPKRSEDVSKRIKTIADSTRVTVDSITTVDLKSPMSFIVAGFALTYRRAFLVGDRVRIADFTGDVMDTRLQVTILRTVKNEEIIVPNSMILNNHVINYSAKARERGLILHTAVTIGYDTPWRQVHEMLLMAARKTPGLIAESEPFVLQKSLDDFYVTYELNVYTDKPEKMTVFYSELHQNIMDVFNEYGVQIMSPNYVADRAEPAIVTKENWYAPPAKPQGEV